jgi:phytoene dehydrogenase-like protein
MSEFKVGDKVQTFVDGKVKDAEVADFFPKERQYPNWNDKEATAAWYALSQSEKDKVYDRYLLKLEDGSEEITAYPHERDTEMERSFRLIAEEAQEKIDEKLSEASRLLDEAESISEQYGVPFSSGISPLSQSYFPNSFKKKFPDLDMSTAGEIADAHGEYDCGWQHSAVC